MSRISKEEIIKRAEEYIQSFIKMHNEEPQFKELNKKAVSDFEELQAYMSLYKYGTAEYQKLAYRYMKKIFS